MHLTLGAMVFACTLICEPALPASAEAATAEVHRSSMQSLDVAVSAPEIAVDRGEYAVQLFSVVQWPVAKGTEISSGFGYRLSPCSGCSSDHHGVDWTPGAGTPVAAIADGVVTEVGNPSGELGVFVTIEHVIDGKVVSSTYGHLAYGTMPFAIGSKVARGDTVGRVGSTGLTSGPHLHFQIQLGSGAIINPLPWLAEHVNS